jgi:NAD(P)-dependent dehydrogenase (short-subunit alcohol dehydrogenase family)
VLRRLEGKVAVVTGGGSGIGRATAERLAHEGCRVAIADLALANAEAVAQRIAAAGGQAIAVACDQGDGRSVAALVATTVAKFGALDFLHRERRQLGEILADTDALSVPLGRLRPHDPR